MAFWCLKNSYVTINSVNWLNTHKNCLFRYKKKTGTKIRLKIVEKAASLQLGRCSKDRKCSGTGTGQNIWFNKLYHHICCICLLVRYTPLYSCVQCCWFFVFFPPKWPLTRRPNFCYWTPKTFQLSQIMWKCKTLSCVLNKRHFFWFFLNYKTKNWTVWAMSCESFFW